MVFEGLGHAPWGCVGEHAVETMDGFPLNLLWDGQVGVDLSACRRDGSVKEVEEAVFFAGGNADGVGRDRSGVGQEGS